MSGREKEKKAMTKDRLIGMQVIDGEGYGVGTVQDIAFTVGKVGMTLIIDSKKGETREVPWEEIQAAGDYVLLKLQAGYAAQTLTMGAPATAQAQQQVCSTCKGPLTYIPQYQRWYCYKCQKYA